MRSNGVPIHTVHEQRLTRGSGCYQRVSRAAARVRLSDPRTLAGLGSCSEVTLPGPCQRESDPERWEWHLGCPHTRSLGPLQALRLWNVLRRTVMDVEVFLWEAGPWALSPALPLIGCVTWDDFLFWASVFPL